MQIRIEQDYKLNLFKELLDCEIVLYKDSQPIPDKIKPLETIRTIEDGVVFFTFKDVQWDNATITANNAIIRDSEKNNILYLDFVTDQVSINGTFKIKFPARLITLE